MTPGYWNRLLFLLLLSAFALQGFSQTPQFEGKITYAMTYESKDSTLNTVVHRLPQRSYLYIRGSQSRFEQPSGNGNVQIFIGDARRNTAMLAIRYKESAFYVVLDSNDLKKNESYATNQYVTRDDNHHRYILGHDCYEIYIHNGSNDSLLAFVSKDIPLGFKFRNLPKMEGLPLQYETRNGQLKIELTAIKIEYEQLSDTVFAAPSNMPRLNHKVFVDLFSR